MQTSIFLGNFNILEIVPVFWKFMEVIQEWWMYSIPSGFEISLIQSSEMSKNDSRTSGIPVGLVRRTTAYFWFSHKLHWLYIFQTSEWYIRTSDFYNPLARRTSAFNLKFRSLTLCNMHGMLKISIIFHAWHLWKLTRFCKQLHFLCPRDPWNWAGTALLNGFQSSLRASKSTE